jgi:hypothetical protein
MQNIKYLIILSIVAGLFILAACEQHEILDRGVTATGAKVAFVQASLKSDSLARPVVFWLGSQKISGLGAASSNRFPGTEWCAITPGSYDVKCFFQGKVKADSILIGDATNFNFQDNKNYTYCFYDKYVGPGSAPTGKVFEQILNQNKLYKVNLNFINLLYGPTGSDVKIEISSIVPAQNFKVPISVTNSLKFEANVLANDFQIIKSDSVTNLQKGVTMKVKVSDAVTGTLLIESAALSFTEGRTYTVVIFGNKDGAATKRRIVRFNDNGMVP